MATNWLGSPQHVVGGAAVAVVAALVLRRSIPSPLLLAAFAIGMASVAELALEVAEYPTNDGAPDLPTAYADTIVDIASSLVGAVIGAAAGVALALRHRA